MDGSVSKPREEQVIEMLIQQSPAKSLASTLFLSGVDNYLGMGA
jgi:hypothetical protein